MLIDKSCEATISSVAAVYKMSVLNNYIFN